MKRMSAKSFKNTVETLYTIFKYDSISQQEIHAVLLKNIDNYDKDEQQILIGVCIDQIQVLIDKQNNVTNLLDFKRNKETNKTLKIQERQRHNDKVMNSRNERW